MIYLFPFCGPTARRPLVWWRPPPSPRGEEVLVTEALQRAPFVLSVPRLSLPVTAVQGALLPVLEVVVAAVVVAVVVGAVAEAAAAAAAALGAPKGAP